MNENRHWEITTVDLNKNETKVGDYEHNISFYTDTYDIS